jgi:hypothetical protein
MSRNSIGVSQLAICDASNHAQHPSCGRLSASFCFLSAERSSHVGYAVRVRDGSFPLLGPSTGCGTSLLQIIPRDPDKRISNFPLNLFVGESKGIHAEG